MGNGVYNNAGSDSSNTEGTSYTASYGAPADSADDGYGSPSASPSDSYGVPLADSDYEEDTLPQYNNGVYNKGGSASSNDDGTSYTAPSADSYGAPSAASATGDAAAATGYAGPAKKAPTAGSRPITGSYKDPEADILPEYFKSEIN